jgi:cytochrome c oxidase assembly protein subunit 15
MTFLQKMATAALVSVIALICVGAIVRVTGAGLGCPDWPTCWGCLIPPWKKEQIDVSKLDLAKFRHEAERRGRDVATVTPEHVLEYFDPVRTWTEFINRLCSIPVVVFSFMTAVAAAGKRKRWPWVNAAAITALLLVFAAGGLGALVVRSGLKPWTITAHLGIAMASLISLVYVAWRGTPTPWLIQRESGELKTLRVAVVALLFFVLAEGIMGSQIREKTDLLAMAHQGMDRSSWIGELEHAPIYLIHRSFSWAILLAAGWAWSRMRKGGSTGRIANGVMILVLAQMVLGVVMSQLHIFAVVQVLHVVFSGCLVAGATLWLCGTFPTREKVTTLPAES